MGNNTNHKIQRDASSYKRSFYIISTLFFLSGASGLIFQTVWVRLLEIFFGVTLVAITLIVSSYMAGLGIGTLIGGRLASKLSNSKQNIKAYGVVQLGIALFGFLSPQLIDWVGRNTAGSSYALVFILSFLLMVIPTMLMGMTLPFLVQAFNLEIKETGKTIGFLYGINTLGAAFGALLAGFWLIGFFGFGGAIIVAVSCNFLAGIGALYLHQTIHFQSGKDRVSDLDEAEKPQTTWNFKTVWLSAFLVGFIGMGFEMLWIRFLGIISKNTAYTFPGILFVYLFAYALGGWLLGRKSDKCKDPIAFFCRLELTIGIVTAACFLIAWSLINLPSFQPIIQGNFNRIQQANPLPVYVSALKDEITEVLVFSRRHLFIESIKFFAPIILMVFPTAFLMGGSLPILDRIAIEKAEESGRRVSDIHLSNVIGSVLGTLLTSFIFLPLFGSELTQKLLSLITLTFFFLLFIHNKKILWKKQVAFPILLISLVFLLPGKGSFYTRFYQLITKNTHVIIDESGDALLSLTFSDGFEEADGLWIGGIQNSYFPSNGEYERSALTCAAAVKPKKVLIIGFGGGNTAKFFGSLPGVEKIVVVELVEELGQFLSEHIGTVDEFLKDPRVEYIIDDGRRYLYANPNETFDLIFIDPMWSYQAGHNNLYSEEAITLYQSHLVDSGIFCSWTNEGHFIPKTIASIFDFSDNFSDFIVSGNSPMNYDVDYMNEVYESFVKSLPEEVRTRSLKMMEPELIVNGRISDRERTLLNNIGVPVLKDMNPWLEYFFICPTRFVRELNVYQLGYCSQRS